jgi:hypothetical protein
MEGERDIYIVFNQVIIKFRIYLAYVNPNTKTYNADKNIKDKKASKENSGFNQN